MGFVACSETKTQVQLNTRFNANDVPFKHTALGKREWHTYLALSSILRSNY